jgi:hypothetical protein
MSFQIRTSTKELRADITDDGTVQVGQTVIAFLNDDGSAGDKSQVFLGDLHENCNVRNASEKCVGTVDENNLTCYDIDKRVFVKINEMGEIFSGSGKLVGSISPFRKKDWKLIVAYLYFVDPALVLSNFFSLVKGTTGKVFSSSKPLMLILDKQKVLRAKITADGSVTNPEEVLVGFLNEDGSAGDDKERFLGEITQDCRAMNKIGAEIGKLNESAMSIYEGENIIAKVESNGDLFDEKQQHCGHVEFFTAKKFRMVSGYLLFFDAGLIKSRALSLVVRNIELEEQLKKEEEEKKEKKATRRRRSNA